VTFSTIVADAYVADPCDWARCSACERVQLDDNDDRKASFCSYHCQCGGDGELHYAYGSLQGSSVGEPPGNKAKNSASRSCLDYIGSSNEVIY
jgi:hypothetical protein